MDVTLSASGSTAPLLNVRDVGGTRLTGGRLIRNGVLIRSEVPDDATAARALFHRINLRQVVDLRDGGEVSVRPSPFVGSEAVITHAPIETSLVLATASDATADPMAAVQMETAADLGSLYLRFLDHATQSFVTVARVVADSDAATLVHCTLGKDRTGVAIALLLSLVGAHDDSIVEDYVRTAAAMSALRDRLGRDATTSTFDWTTVPPIVLEAPAAAMEVFLAGLADRGGSEAVLRASGLSVMETERLRSRLRG